jgi:adenylate kinase family enzyme
MKKYNRIWILGGTGSGKSFLAKRLSGKLSLPAHTTDFFVYSKDFKKKYSPEIKSRKILEVSKRKKWIIEGVHRADWILPAFDKSDFIIFIDTKVFTRLYRVFRREFFEKRVNLKSFPRIIYYALIYFFDSRKHHLKMIRERNKDFLFLKNKKEINEFLKEIK